MMLDLRSPESSLESVEPVKLLISNTISYNITLLYYIAYYI